MFKQEVVVHRDAHNVSEVKHLFLFDAQEDQLLAPRNKLFWQALIGHIRADGTHQPNQTVLDIGCHHGGLLKLLYEQFKCTNLIGIEPLLKARKIANSQLSALPVDSRIICKSQWSLIPSSSVDLIVCHEVLQFVEDIEQLLNNCFNVLRNGGFAYFVLGCHSENPLWETWRQALQQINHQTFNHSPIEIIKTANKVGFASAVRPLRNTGWIHYDADESQSFSYPSIHALFEHQYKHKIIFRFEKFTSCPT